VPLLILAAVSMANVIAQSNEQSRRLLRQTSREAAMGIMERLTYAETELRLAASSIAGTTRRTNSNISPSVVLPANLAEHFKGLGILFSDGRLQLLTGKLDATVHFSDDEQRFLASGKSLISNGTCPAPIPCLFLSRKLSQSELDHSVLIAQLETSHLWGTENLPPLIDLCVLDQLGGVLFCPQADPSQFSPKIASTFAGQFEWKSGNQDYLSDYWSVPLKPTFFVTRWTVIASESKSDVFAPLSRFKRVFLLTVLLSFWVVLLLSMIQIRRNMVPLTRLQEGTKRITQGDLRTRVAVPGIDEFADLASSFNFMAARIEKQVNSLKTINEIDRAILSSWNMERIVDALVARLRGLLAYDVVGISLLAPDSPLQAVTYVSLANAGAEKQVTATTLLAEEVRALRDCHEVKIPHAGNQPPGYLVPLVQQGMHCFLVVPIFLKEQLSAIISLGLGTNSAWSEEDKEQAKQLADQVAVALSNARLISELKQLHWGTLTALARAIDAKSSWTAGHSERVTSWALKIAQAMGLPEHELEIIQRGGLLHDIGKIGTPVAVLDKPGKLTDQEMQQMREHVRIGARILEPIPGFAECLPIVLQHHEWVDGSGYPEGLAGDQIHLHARIFAVADCYDALISDRPYRAGMPPDRVASIIQAGVGKQFDPQVAAVFFTLLEQEKNKAASQDNSLLPVGAA
jgi:putative nucleotidyltransferase with HDIG domain